MAADPQDSNRLPGINPELLVRECFTGEGYVFARKAEEIAREHGLERVARLASNENPEPPEKEVIEEGCRALQEANRYPDENMGELKAMLGRYHGWNHFVTGAGMDGVIETLLRLLVNAGDPVVISVPTFSFYELATIAQGGTVIRVPRDGSFNVDVESFIQKARHARLSFLCTPNNPTGNETSPDDIAGILEEIEGIFFLDNAYVEFSDQDYRPLMERFDNLVIGRTMSKAFSMAGLRVGYAFVPGWILPYYRRAATPFSLNSVSAAAAVSALGDRGHVERIVRRVKGWRARYIRECSFPVFPSGGNFVLVDVSPCSGDVMTEKLAARGVIVRSCRSFKGLEDHYIRVSVGDDWECELFLDVINSI